MKLDLTPEIRKLIEQRMQTGGYDSPEHVLLAALYQLEQQDSLGSWSPADLKAALQEGEESILSEGCVDGEEAFAALRLRLQNRK